MNFILLSDLHLTSKQPRSRTGNILKDCSKKLRFIFKTAERFNAHIICSGDVFDSPRDIFALYEFIRIRTKYSKVKFFTVYGQHDSYMRSKITLNNLAILSKTKQITLLNTEPYNLENVSIYGSGWNEEIPQIEQTKFNILAIHKSIFGCEIFPGQEFTEAEKFLRENEFNLIISGDIHRNFILKKWGRIILNTGPIVRLEATDFNRAFKPRMYLYNTENKSIREYFLPCREDVFDKRFTSLTSLDSELIDKEFIEILSKQDNQNIDEIINQLLSIHKNKIEIEKKLAELEKMRGRY